MLHQHEESTASRSAPRPPELPRVLLDTRMPPAPAPGGRVIVVGKPAPRPRRADLTFGALVLGGVLVALALLRWARMSRRG